MNDFFRHFGLHGLSTKTRINTKKQHKSDWDASVDIVRRGGRVLWLGGLPGGTKVEIDAVHVHYGEIDLYNMRGGTTENAQKVRSNLQH